VVAAQGEGAWAARLWGAAESVRELVSSPLPLVLRAGYEQVIATVRMQLGEKRFATAWAQGRAMTPEQVLVAQHPYRPPHQLPIGPASAPLMP
jgi:hypothetical protein